MRRLTGLLARKGYSAQVTYDAIRAELEFEADQSREATDPTELTHPGVRELPRQGVLGSDVRELDALVQHDEKHSWD
jgi:hypothetical protein